MAEFSDPAWWPKPPPRAPQPASVSSLLVRTLLPLAAIAGVVALVVVTQHGGRSNAPPRSGEAYESCLAGHGVDPATGAAPPVEQRAERACRSFLPPGAVAPGSAAANGQSAQESAAQASFRACVHDAIGARGAAGGGPGRGRPSPASRAAFSVCASLAGQGAAASGAPASPATPAATSPAATTPATTVPAGSPPAA